MLLGRLSEAFGLPGQEDEVRAIIKEELSLRGVGFRADAIGNVITEPTARGRGPRVMVAAHMDEVGLVITGFERTGLLRCKPIGGMDDRVLVSKTVNIGPDKVPGVIGAKAIHLQEPEERARAIKSDSLYIDIGVSSKEEAQKHVKLGDGAAFLTSYEEIGQGMAKGKAFDDRVGCALLLNLHSDPTPSGLDIYGAFTVQEEVGTRGAWVAAYSIDPDFAIVLECTSASDVPETLAHQCPSSLGKGPAISFMDSSLVVNPRAMRALVETAEESGVPFQLKQTTAGGTDGGRINTTRQGVPTVVISVPCRYLHSPVSLVSLADYEMAGRLLSAFLCRLGERGLPV